MARVAIMEASIFGPFLVISFLGTEDVGKNGEKLDDVRDDLNIKEVKEADVIRFNH